MAGTSVGRSGRQHGWLFLIGALLLGTTPAMAQDTGSIRGQVTDAQTLRPLVGVQVTVPGTGLGALTSSEGRYEVRGVTPGEVQVRAMMLGFAESVQTVTVSAGDVANLDFGLRPTALALDEVIVTGTGRPTERRRLSTDIAVLGEDLIQASGATNVTELLQGRVPGAQVNAVGAQPGSTGLMSFRGPSSALADQTPVIYIDGVRVDNSRFGGGGGVQTSALADLPLSDIERVEVTRGGAASTLYGADAAAGVIQIFTRRGGTGESRVTARVEQGLDLPETRFIQDADFVFPAERFPDARNHPSWDPDFVKNEILTPGYFQAYSLSAVGGGPELGYSLSGRVQDSEGIQPLNASTQVNLHAGFRARLTETLSADLTGTYVRHEYEVASAGTGTAGIFPAVEVGNWLSLQRATNLGDALENSLRRHESTLVDRFTVSNSLAWSPLSFFDTRLTLGVDRRSSTTRLNEAIDFLATARTGALQTSQRDFTGVTFDAQGTLTYDLPGFTNSSTTLGVQGFRESINTFSGLGQDLPLPGVTTFNSAARVTASGNSSAVFNGGFFLLQQAGIRDQVFLEAGIRFDGNTAFGSDVSYQAYPKVGASYDLASADLLPDWMNTLRIRGNYGVTGKFPPPFLRDRTFSASPFGGESAPRFANPGNPDLQPERVSTYELGLDADIWNGRIGLNVTGYRAVTTDALLATNLQPSTGLQSQVRNMGEILNQGLEIGANVDVVRTASVLWSLSGTLNTLKNEVLDLGGMEPFELSTLSGRREFGRVQVGYPLGVRYMNYPVDTNGDGLFDDTERGIVRHPETGKLLTPFPTRTGSLRSQLTLPSAGLSFSASGDWSWGSTIQDYGSVWSWGNNVRRINFPMRHDLSGNEVGHYVYTQAFNYTLLRGDFIKLRELSARYDLPQELLPWMPGQRASLSLAVRNLYTWVPAQQSLFDPDARRNLLDPELHGFAEPTGSSLQLGGSQSIAIPPPRSIRLGFEITF
jgi:TonB-dependent starch-binding outer membrane protein SusC